MNSESPSPWALAVCLVVVSLMPAIVQASDSHLELQALQWRNIGPFNGGRGTSVVGHPTDSQVFYFGHSSGGLWKTEDAGTYWMPVGEGQFNYASVGAIALYEKNPDIMYVGLGEPQLRQSVSWGDGMYKTIDGGETWQHIGLTDALHIANVSGSIRTTRTWSTSPPWGTPSDPTRRRASSARRDGGQTWEKDPVQEPEDRCHRPGDEPADPNVLFAALWEFERKGLGRQDGRPRERHLSVSRRRRHVGGDLRERRHARGHDGPRRPRHVEGRPRTGSGH